MKFKRTAALLLIALLPMLLIACGGGGGGGGGASNTGTTTTPAPLTVATKVSVVDPQLSGTVASAKPLKINWASMMLKTLATSLTSTSDYNSDRTQVWVNEQSTDQLRTINMILCMIGQTRYDAMLNQGNYIALVDNNQCSSNNSDASSAGAQSQNQSSGANMPDYYSFTVNSSRPDNNSPETVKIWIHQPQDGQNNNAAYIYANVVITAGTSSTNPYGLFTMDFAGFNYNADGTLPASPSFKGTLESVLSNLSDPTSKVLLKFASADSKLDSQCGAVSSSTAIALDRQPDGSGGAGHIQQTVNTASCAQANGTMEFDIAYNSTDFWRHDLSTAGTPSVCLSRTNFSESSWSYALYDATGSRVIRNSGFPIVYGSGNQYQGYVSYWGLWTNNGSPALTNGETVNKVDYNNGSTTSTPYTVFQVGGKLHRHDRQTMTLADIVNIPLSYWEQPMSGGTGTNYEVVWTGSAFNEVAYMPQNCNGNCTWANLAAPQPIDFTHLNQNSLNFYSDSLSGQAQVPLSCTFTQPTMTQPGYNTCTPPQSSNSVIFYSDMIVYPGDTVPGNLRCYDNCPNATSSGVDLSLNNGYTTNMMSGPSMTPTPTNYTFITTTGTDGMTLMLGSNPVTLTTVSTTQQWGIMSGPLFDPTTANMNALICPWSTTQICSWQAWSVLPEFFTWETGPNNWNQFVGVEDSTGAFVKFQPPLEVKYVGFAGPAGSPPDIFGTPGTTYMLQYGGFGQLNGIPGKCVDMNTGADADCSQGGGNNSIQWVPQFIIPPHSDAAGTLTTVSVTDPATPNAAATSCFMKPLQVEQRMMKDAPSACAFSSTVDFSLDTLPDMSIYADPTASNGTEPTVTAAPAVIGGVVQ